MKEDERIGYVVVSHRPPDRTLVRLKKGIRPMSQEDARAHIDATLRPKAARNERFFVVELTVVEEA